MHGVGIELRLGAGSGEAGGNGALQLSPALGGSCVITRSAYTTAEYVAVLVADQCGGAGLPPVNTQEEFHWHLDCSSGRLGLAVASRRVCLTVLGISAYASYNRALAVAALIRAPRVCRHLQSRDRKGAVPGAQFPKAVKHSRTVRAIARAVRNPGRIRRVLKATD